MRGRDFDSIFFYYLFLISLLVASFLIAPGAHALESKTVKAEFSALRLITGTLQLPSKDGKNARLDAGIEIHLDAGWKTYWRSPGDGGFPMTVQLDKTARNIRDVTIEWPFASRFVEEWGLETFGYKNTVVIPVILHLIDPADHTQANLLVSYAVCSDICINEEHRVSLLIPQNYEPDSEHTKRLNSARARVPVDNGSYGMTIKSARIKSEDEKQHKGVLLVVAMLQKGKFQTMDLFVEGIPGIRFPKPAVKMTKENTRAEFMIPYEISPPAKTLKNSEVMLTFVHGQKAVEAKFDVE